MTAPSGKENRVALLCAGVLVLEGFDLGAMAFTLPALSESWHLKPVAFTAALTAGSVGLFLGSLLCGWLGDRLGRKPVLMGCVAIFGIMSLADRAGDNDRHVDFRRVSAPAWASAAAFPPHRAAFGLRAQKRQGGLVMAMTCGVQPATCWAAVVARLSRRWAGLRFSSWEGSFP